AHEEVAELRERRLLEAGVSGAVDERLPPAGSVLIARIDGEVARDLGEVRAPGDLHPGDLAERQPARLDQVDRRPIEETAGRWKVRLFHGDERLLGDRAGRDVQPEWDVRLGALLAEQDDLAARGVEVEVRLLADAH